MVDPAGARRSANSKLTPAEIVIVAAGAVALIFSFLPWYKFGSRGYSAWSSGLFPLATLVALIGAVMAAQIALDKFSVATLPRRLGDFTWEQIHLVASTWAVVLVFCYLILDRGGASLGVGFFFELIAAIALLVGAILLRKERGGIGRGL